MIITFLADSVVCAVTIRLHLTTFPPFSTPVSAASLIFMLVIRVIAFGLITKTALSRTCNHSIDLFAVFKKLGLRYVSHRREETITFAESY